MYVDGYVVPVPKKNVAAYARLARAAGKVFREHGALQYFECVGDDLNLKWGMPFPKAFRVKAGETVFFSWILYKSKAQRDRVNAKVMKDRRMATMPKKMPFDMKRMVVGGFKVLVDV